MYQVTGDTRIVKELLGHSTAAMTERYTLGHVPAYMQVAAARFQKLSNGTESPRPSGSQGISRTGSSERPW